jgi:histidinol-phosphate aminotransferase
MSVDRIKRWIRPAILSTRAYHVAVARGLIKLDAMENPYPWPDTIKQDWLRRLEAAEINRYPSSDAKELKAKIQLTFALPPDQDLLLGNGSDEIIQMIVMAMAGERAVFIAPEPTFVMYATIAAAARARFVGIPLRDDFTLDRRSMLRAIADHQPAAIFLAYPNNPTANLFAWDDMLEIIERAPGIVVVDEAYHVFAESSLMARIGEYENLLIMRTLSKLGLAGLRLGYLVGPSEWIREFDKLRLPYNINVLTQISVEFILDHVEHLYEQAARIRADRETLRLLLASIPGVRVWPSATNFLIFRVEAGGGDRVFDGLKQAGVLVKNLHHGHPLLADCLRVTVGTPAENSAFASALKHVLRN